MTRFELFYFRINKRSIEPILVTGRAKHRETTVTLPQITKLAFDSR